MEENKSPTLYSKTFKSVIWHLDIAFWGICGALARDGLIALTDFEYWGPLWANVAGCVVIGFHERFVHDPIYRPKISVGFCGSLTSFSSLIVTLFNFSTTPTDRWKTDGYGVMAFLAYLIIELACSIASYFFGRHLERAFTHSKLSFTPNYVVIEYLGAALGLAAWIAVLVVAITVKSERHWPLAGVFAPIGVYVRFYLGKLNRPQLRIGTFAANMSATVLACIFTILQHPDIGPSYLQQQVLIGLVDGFCGCLSTVSSLVVELTSLPLKKAYTYGFVTCALGFCFAVLIIGSFNWTR